MKIKIKEVKDKNDEDKIKIKIIIKNKKEKIVENKIKITVLQSQLEIIQRPTKTPEPGTWMEHMSKFTNVLFDFSIRNNHSKPNSRGRIHYCSKFYH